MSDYKLQSSKFHVEAIISATGLIGPAEGYKLYGEETVVLSVNGVFTGTDVDIEGRLAGDTAWTTLGTIIGHGRGRVDISKVDYIRFNVIRLNKDVNVIARLNATGFFSDSLQEKETTNAVLASNKIMLRILEELKLININLNINNQQLSYMTDVEVVESEEIL